MSIKRHNIVRDMKGRRYLLTTRRIVELDSPDAKSGVPWYVLNKDIREAYNAYTLSKPVSVNCYPRLSSDHDILSVFVSFGPLTINAKKAHPEYTHSLQIGCGLFNVPNFQRILKNAGCKVTQYALAAKAGA